MARRLLVVGESLVEFVRPERGIPIEEPGPFLGPFPSGAPAICADAAALAGADVVFVSTVGADPFGTRIVQRLRKDGVDVSGVRVLEGAVTGAAFVSYSSDGSRTFVFYVADAAPGRIQPEDLGSAPAGADWIHVSGASLQLAPAMSVTIAEAAERVVHSGGRISLDPNLRAGSSGVSEAPEVMTRLIELASLFLPAEGELERLGIDPMALARRGAVVCVTCGAKGARVYTSEGVATVPGIEVREVDPTGAGDTFAGVFLATFLRTGDAHLAAVEGNRAGAAHVAAMGPMERAIDWQPPGP